MARTRSSRITRAVLGVVLTTAFLSACAAETTAVPAGDYLPISLADSKSPVQLLRNEVAGRIPPAAITDVAESGDTSEACLTEAADPKGMIRRWTSSLTADVAPSSAWRIDEVANELFATFSAEGWTISPGIQSVTTVTTLNKDSSLAFIQLAVTKGEVDAEGSSIRITSVGPCVVTDGKASQEVTNLESFNK